MRKEEKQKAREKGKDILAECRVQFQRIARRDKKVFRSEKYKEI